MYNSVNVKARDFIIYWYLKSKQFDVFSKDTGSCCYGHAHS